MPRVRKSAPPTDPVAAQMEALPAGMAHISLDAPKKKKGRPRKRKAPASPPSPPPPASPPAMPPPPPSEDAKGPPRKRRSFCVVSIREGVGHGRPSADTLTKGGGNYCGEPAGAAKKAARGIFRRLGVEEGTLVLELRERLGRLRGEDGEAYRARKAKAAARRPFVYQCTSKQREVPVDVKDRDGNVRWTVHTDIEVKAVKPPKAAASPPTSGPVPGGSTEHKEGSGSEAESEEMAPTPPPAPKKKKRGRARTKAVAVTE